MTANYRSVQGDADGNVYRLDGSGTDDPFILSVHPAPGLPFDYIVELHQKALTQYFPARKIDGGLAVAMVTLSSDLKETLEKQGVLDKDGTINSSDPENLYSVLRAWAKDQQGPLTFGHRYRVAIGEEAQNALMLEGLTELCLSVAGHALDPMVRKLPEKFASGVAMGSIDTKTAEKLCGWGDRPEAPASVRYALARVRYQAKDFAGVNLLVDGLMNEGFPLAFVMRADQLIHGDGVDKDVDAGRRLLESKADQYPVVANNLGWLHENGTFGTPDFEAAYRYYQQADSAGVAPAATGLGRLYSNGSGVGKDESRAFRLFLRGAHGGDRYGDLEAARALYFGNGTDEDQTAAFRHANSAAEAGIPEAEYFVGFMLARGQGTTQSKSDAVKWLQKASDGGWVEAKAELGVMTYNGEGVTADRAKGRQLLQEAAAAGSSRAKTALAELDATSLPEFSSDVPGSVKDDVRKLGGDEAFAFNRTNLPFTAGMAQYLVKECGLPENYSDRAELGGLVGNGVSGLLGNDYSDPDILKGIGQMMGSNALFAAGLTFARQISCDSKLASHLADRLVEASRSNKSGPQAHFIPSCARAFDQTRCTCLAQIGRGVIPDIYQRYYDRSIIKEIISRNPLTALTIAMSCQIVNY